MNENGIPDDGGGDYMYRLNRGLEKVEYKKTGTMDDWKQDVADDILTDGCMDDARRRDPPISDSDPVDHPAHYCSHPSGVECIEITRHHDFCTGNAIKYLFRAGLKGGSEKRIEDLRKAKKYIEFAIENEMEGK